MKDGQQRFIRELTKEIGNHTDQADIIAEYELHVYELVKELSIDEENSYEAIVKRLGTPREISKAWKQEVGMTPRKTQWLFILCNLAIFIGGTILTICYNFFDWIWLEQVWFALTDVSFIIMLIYLLFWGLLGYEIGKEFGHRGYRLLKRTFVISIVPNLLLMYLIVFKVLPYEWFQPLLNFPFIVTAMFFTGLLYPVSWLGYRWGRKVSV